jgi:hypothetical protein
LGGGGAGENGKNNNGSKESTHLIDASGLIVIPRLAALGMTALRRLQ